MASDPALRRPRRQLRAWLLSGTVLAGAGLAFLSWWLQNIDAWGSAFLANMAVVVLLLIPGELLLAGVRTRVEQAENTASRAETTADAARLSAEASARSLEDIRNELVARQEAELDEEVAPYRDLLHLATRDSLLRALRKATCDGLITPSGVRVPVWETDVHFRYLVNDTKPDLLVRLEEDDGKILAERAWSVDVESFDFYQSLVQAVRDAGRDLGTGLNLPTQSVEELSSMLSDVTALRAQSLAGHRQTLKKIIERRDGWYFTEDHVIPADHLHYVIGVNQLDQLDWEEHLRGKGWYSAPDAIQFARRLYHISTPPPAA